MIIKRRVTREFVQIANEVVRDRRLSLAAHGLLHYLLSLPNDWEVNLKHIEKYWRIGRDRRRTLFNELRRFGWAQLERITSDEDGTFLGQRWIIGDEPGPESTDDTADVDDEDSEDADDSATAMNATTAPESQTPDVLAPGHRETPSQGVGPPDGRVARPPENTSLPRRKNLEEEIDSTNTSGARGNSNDDDDGSEPPPPFGSLLKLWPADNIASAFACEKAYAKLDDLHKVQAHRSVQPYLQDCREKGQTRLCDLRTYLDERRFERFANRQPGKQFFTVKLGTPQDNAKVDRWRDHFRRTAPNKIAVFDMLVRGRGYTTETEWPPPVDPLTKAS